MECDFDISIPIKSCLSHKPIFEAGYTMSIFTNFLHGPTKHAPKMENTGSRKTYQGVIICSSCNLIYDLDYQYATCPHLWHPGQAPGKVFNYLEDMLTFQ